MDGPKEHRVTHLHACLGATQVSVRLAPVQDSFDSSTRQIHVALQVYAFLYGNSIRSLVASLFLTMSSRVYLFLPPRGHTPLPTLHSRINPYLCCQRLRFPIICYGKRPDIALYAIGLRFTLPTPSSLHSVPSMFPTMIRFGNRPPLSWISAPAYKSLLVRNAV